MSLLVKRGTVQVCSLDLHRSMQRRSALSHHSRRPKQCVHDRCAWRSRVFVFGLLCDLHMIGSNCRSTKLALTLGVHFQSGVTAYEAHQETMRRHRWRDWKSLCDSETSRERPPVFVYLDLFAVRCGTYPEGCEMVGSLRNHPYPLLGLLREAR
jgi:hypothetical protein